ncbi:hypothetical protein [Oceanirhabdus sp. W0125-5]|uniref:hypothetical protein n=1 Tax=Oceanirhabdus sp. W0125-5 TaxID=2999116 RepID=UPI0022F2D2AD|nr:hypothetical protein [Oceanirhabdus sp. W0125-5]WBW94882.1 hypothetical protein OW730_14375 [Oceanirhabdus sp. W0125-5]
MKNRKRVKRILLSIIIILAIGVLTIGMAPVSFDSVISKNDFKKRIADDYKLHLGELFLNNHEHNSMISYMVVPDIEELVQNMEWEGRIIKTKSTVKFEGEEYIVEYVGKRYWIKQYNWDLVNITKKEIDNNTSNIKIDQEADVAKEKKETETTKKVTDHEPVEEDSIKENDITEEKEVKYETSKEKDNSEEVSRQVLTNVDYEKNSLINELGLEEISKDTIAIIINNPKEILKKVSKLEEFKYDEYNESLLIIPIYNQMRIELVTLEFEEKIKEKDVIFTAQNLSDGYGLHLFALRPCGMPSLKIKINANGIGGEYLLDYDGRDGTPQIEFIKVKKE